MAEKLVAARHRWTFVCAVPAREVFASMEQMLGTPPFRFEVVGPATARIVEAERCNLVGAWSSMAVRDSDGTQRVDGEGRPLWRRPVRWVRVTAEELPAGTSVTVEASRGLRGPLGRLPTGGDGPTVKRALQLVSLLTRGDHDRRTIYRNRAIPPGPVTLVASWAGMLYPLYTEPRYDAPRGEPVHTASKLVAVAHLGRFVAVRAPSGTEGYIEADQLVPAPADSTRAAQPRVAAIG